MSMLESSELARAISEVQVHDHLCLIYRTEDEQAAAVAPYFAQGLRAGERCVYITDDPASHVVFDRMRELGVDPDEARASGALVVLDKRDSYLRGGRFDPDAMLVLLREAVETAQQDGFARVRVTGEMTWALGGDPGCERLAEYEAKLNRDFPGLQVSAICQYDARRFDASVLRGVIETHPLVIYGGLVCKNAYYVPPEEFLAPDQAARQVDRILANILERERAEEAVRELNARLESRVAERTRQLAAANADLESFAYTVSHDLRAPLRSIGFFADILEQDYGAALPEEARAHLVHMAGEARRAMRLVDDLLALSTPTAGAHASERVDLTALARSITEELGVAQPDRAVVARAQPGVAVQGEAPLLRIVLQNLLGNAWKYTARREDACVEFGARRAGTEWECYVRDNGVGFSMSAATRLFQPFQRLHGAEFEGSGVGLATVKRIVTRHGGRVWAESEPGVGTTIWFRLPAA